MDTTHLGRATGVPLLLTACLLVTGCSGGGDSASEAGDAGGAPAVAEAPGSQLRDGPADESLDALTIDTARSGSGSNATQSQDQPLETDRAIIATGTVALLGTDVAADRFDVQKVVDVHGGEVAEEKTQTDDDGHVSRSRLVVRVPVDEFDATMEELEEVAELESSSRSSEDVTMEVIDTEVRIRAQAASLRRIELLLARAQSIRDIVAIEAQLTRRQAELDALKSQQAYLADQTSMSTITVYLEQKPDKEKAKAEREEATGFLAGLRAGWDGLGELTTGTLTVVGAVLPFAVLLLVLGVPLWLAARLAVRRREPQVAAE